MSTGLKVFACLAFLGLSFIVWLKSGRSWIVLLVVWVPSYLCSEWLASKIFNKDSRWGARSGFSFLRIIYGGVAALLVFGLAYGVQILFGQFF